MCLIPECEANVPRRMIMCKRHWFSLPHELRMRMLHAVTLVEHREATGAAKAFIERHVA